MYFVYDDYISKKMANVNSIMLQNVNNIMSYYRKK